jgi:hypothetical protein
MAPTTSSQNGSTPKPGIASLGSGNLQISTTHHRWGYFESSRDQSVAFKRKAPLGGAGLIKSAPGGGSGTGGAEGESNISLDKLAANYTLVCGQSSSCRHPRHGSEPQSSGAQARTESVNCLASCSLGPACEIECTWPRYIEITHHPT